MSGDYWTSFTRLPQRKLLVIPLILTLLAVYFWSSLSFSYFATVSSFYQDFHYNFLEGKVALLGTENGTSKDENLACKIPATLPFPKAFEKWDPKKGYKNCSWEQELFQLSDDGQLRLAAPFRGENVDEQPCCLQHILRGSKDSAYNVTECQPVDNETDLRSKEVFIVRCQEHLNVDAHIPDKVTEKVKYWQDLRNVTDPDDTPYSVLIFGHDTVSRAHVYRSVPRAVELMKNLTFVDFDSLHSLWPSTLGNFMAMLMGLERRRVREVCCRNWKTPYDTCPFIWKNFSDAEYVTGYLEDGTETAWNWGGQSGFRKPPTDYYIHHLFRALVKVRGEQSKKTEKKHRLDCVSNDSVSAFQFRYSTRFLRKFQNVPFFYMTWFGYPFHSDLKYLANTEDDMLKFVRFLASQPKLLRKTLMIYVGDHGDRFSYYNGNSIESFFERGNPPLFVRLPDQMVEEFPEFAKNLEKNSKHLVTHFDIHHTLLHILHLANVKSSFDPVLEDRGSLLVELPTNRTCASTHVPKMLCLCNLQYSPTDMDKGKLKKEFGPHVVRLTLNHVNHLLEEYPHGHLCRRWSLESPASITYVRLLGVSPEYNEVLAAFKSAAEAKFEARIRLKTGLNINYISSELESYGEVVGVSRTNSYKNQSACLPTLTDEDKIMKNFCFCKS